MPRKCPRRGRLRARAGRRLYQGENCGPSRNHLKFLHDGAAALIKRLGPARPRPRTWRVVDAAWSRTALVKYARVPSKSSRTTSPARPRRRRGFELAVDCRSLSARAAAAAGPRRVPGWWWRRRCRGEILAPSRHLRADSSDKPKRRCRRRSSRMRLRARQQPTVVLYSPQGARPGLAGEAPINKRRASSARGRRAARAAGPATAPPPRRRRSSNVCPASLEFFIDRERAPRPPRHTSFDPWTASGGCGADELRPAAGRSRRIFGGACAWRRARPAGAARARRRGRAAARRPLARTTLVPRLAYPPHFGWRSLRRSRRGSPKKALLMLESPMSRAKSGLGGNARRAQQHPTSHRVRRNLH